MNEYVLTLIQEFERLANPSKAVKMKAYMKNHFEFFGISSPERKLLQKPFFVQKDIPKKEELEKIVKELWLKPEREFNYFTQELVFKYKNQLQKEDIFLFEFMIVNKSWWDSIDFISPNLVGQYFKLFPKSRNKIINRWLKSENIWLKRSCLLFQLKYKKDTDTEFLSYIIENLLGSKEFFINKAIGWILREYGKTNPSWVLSFCNKTELSNLSKKEALRIILKT